MVDQVLSNQLQEEQEQSYNTSEPLEVNRARKKEARTRADRLKFVSASMSFPEGRAWFYDILNRSHLFHNPFNLDNQYATAFRCGEHNLGLQILSDIQDAAPKEYILMIEENK